MKRLSIRIFGKVQGVFFRHSAKKEAERLGIRGLVRNEPDGSVYLEVEGEEGALAQFVAWCKVGPRQAEVSKIETQEKPVVGFRDFNIE
jgi:acylphosphatase